MATIRSSSGMRAMSALSSVVLPLPVPPLTRIFRRVCNTRSASSRMCAGSAPCATSCAAEKDRLPKRRTVMATCGLAGGTQMATREPSSRRASRIGVVAGSRPKGRAIWIAARSSAAASSAGASIGRSRPWPSSHTLPGPLIMISLTSGSSSAASKPGRNGFSRSSPSPVIAGRSVSRASTGDPPADSGASGTRAGAAGTARRRTGDRSPDSCRGARSRAAETPPRGGR